MKSTKLLILFSITLLSIQSCDNKNEVSGHPYFKSFEISLMNGDTINLIDYKGRKQGHWIITKFAILNKHNPAEPVRFEEGFYKDNKKEGFWRKFSNVGDQTDSTFYENGIEKK
jgi:hypothetical protein